MGNANPRKIRLRSSGGCAFVGQRETDAAPGALELRMLDWEGLKGAFSQLALRGQSSEANDKAGPLDEMQ